MPHCFVPRTSFLRPLRLGGGRITAAELRKHGGDIVLGLHGAEVRVLGATRHEPPVERDVVNLYTVSNPYPFQVTSDHRLLVEGPNQSFVTVTAGSLVGSQGRRIYDGSGFKDLLDAKLQTETMSVIEVTFVEDACVLAWVLPKNTPKKGRPALQESTAVCCRGSRLRLKDGPPQSIDHFGLITSRTFVHYSEVRENCHRPSSANARLEHRSSSTSEQPAPQQSPC